MTGGRFLTAEQLVVLQEALADACAFRMGESYREDLEDLDREALDRYDALAAGLGWETH